MIKLLRFLVFFSLGLLTISFLKIFVLNSVNFLHTASAQTVINSKEIPERINPCIPRGKSIKNTEINGIVEYKNNKYYSIRVLEEKPTIFENDAEIVELYTVILEDEIGCLVSKPKEKSRTHSMELFIPKSVARLLSLEYTKKLMKEMGGQEAYIKAFEEMPRDAADGPWIFFPEDAWAYEQLGLPFPEPYVIVNSADDPKAQSPTPGMD